MIEPRMGSARFDEARQQRVRRSTIILICAGFVTLALGVLVYFTTGTADLSAVPLESIISALPAFLVGIGCWTAAIAFGIHRIAIYGLVFVAAAGVTLVQPLHPGWSLLSAGVVTTLSGIILLARFFRRFPRLPAEMV